MKQTNIFSTYLLSNNKLVGRCPPCVGWSAGKGQTLGSPLSSDTCLESCPRSCRHATTTPEADRRTILPTRTRPASGLPPAWVSRPPRDPNTPSGLVALAGGEDLRPLVWITVFFLMCFVIAPSAIRSQQSAVSPRSARSPEHLTTQDTSLYGSTMSHSLIGVDTSIWLLAVEEVLDQLLHLRDTLSPGSS